jgi:Zn-dependent peptidase ImmA (M78 family)
MSEKSKTILDKIKEEKIEVIDTGFCVFKIDIKKTLKENNEKCFGLTDFDRGVVSLYKDMNPQLAKETVLHELTHIVLEFCGLGGDETTDIVKERTNEELTTLISRGYLLLMNLNPRLFGLLLNDR